MIAAYVTSHGFGHLNRSVAVLNRLPESSGLTIFSHPGLFPHWRERLRRSAELVAHVCDSGAVNPPGDSQTTDGPATIALARTVHAESLTRLDDDVARLREIGAEVVLSDAASLPLIYARRAGIPGYLLANFTWAEIYRSHADRLGPEARAFVATLRAEYRQATAFLRTEPALAMNDRGVPVENVGLVVSPGLDRRHELRRTLGISEAETIVSFYIGRYGQADLGWENLERLGASGYRFVGFHQAPVGPIANLHVVSPDDWTGADLAASADVIVAKAGYGTVCEALASRTPMIYAPRTGFAEHRALDRALKRWGSGFRASSQDFRSFCLARLLEQARAARPGPSPYPVEGAKRVASILIAAASASRPK